MTHILRRSLLVLLITLMGASLALAGQGNGGADHGGGDFDAQKFVALGQEVADSLDTWRRLDPSLLQEIDLGRLKQALITVTVNSAPAKDVRIFRDGHWDTVDALNSIKENRITLNQDRMSELSSRTHDDQLMFAMHEWLRFLDIDDAKYQVTKRYLNHVEADRSMTAFHKEVGDKLATVTQIYEHALLGQNFNIESLVRLTEETMAYKICTDPDLDNEERIDAYLEYKRELKAKQKDKTPDDGIDHPCEAVGRSLLKVIDSAFSPFKQDPNAINAHQLMLNQYFVYADAQKDPYRRRLADYAGMALLKRLNSATAILNKASQDTSSAMLACKLVQDSDEDNSLQCAAREMRKALAQGGAIPHALKQAYTYAEESIPYVREVIRTYYYVEHPYNPDTL